MDTAKLFQNGGSQAIRIPKEYQFPGTEVCIRKIGDMVVLFSKEKEWDIFEEGLGEFSADFMATRDQGGPAEKRPEL